VKGLQQRHFDYVLGPNQDSRLASVPAGATIESLNLQMATDAPFLLRSRAVRQAYTVSSPPTQNGLQFLKMKWSGPTGDFRQQHEVNVACEMAYFAQCGLWKPEFPETLYPAGGVLSVQIANKGTSPIKNLYMFFRGVKLYPPGTVPAFTYPRNFKGLGNFSYPQTVTALGVSEYRPNQIFTVKTDADFVLRGGSATAPFTISSNRQFSEVFIQLQDWNNKPFSNDFIPLDVMFGAGSYPAAYPVGPSPTDLTPFMGGPGKMGLFYPEIYVPQNRQLIYALQRSDGTAGTNQSETFTINLIGQKVYPS